MLSYITFQRILGAKQWWFVESPDGANVTATQKRYCSNTIESVMTFNLKAGNKYYFYAQGSKPMIYSIYFDKPVDDAQSLITPTDGSTGSGSNRVQSGIERKVKLTWTPVTNDTPVF